MPFFFNRSMNGPLLPQTIFSRARSGTTGPWELTTMAATAEPKVLFVYYTFTKQALKVTEDMESVFREPAAPQST